MAPVLLIETTTAPERPMNVVFESGQCRPHYILLIPTTVQTLNICSSLLPSAVGPFAFQHSTNHQRRIHLGQPGWRKLLSRQSTYSFLVLAVRSVRVTEMLWPTRRDGELWNQRRVRGGPVVGFPQEAPSSHLAEPESSTMAVSSLWIGSAFAYATNELAIRSVVPGSFQPFCSPPRSRSATCARPSARIPQLIKVREADVAVALVHAVLPAASALHLRDFGRSGERAARWAASPR